MRLLKIGRNSSCDIVLASEKVSSFHAEITLLNNGDLFLVDTNSTNGTFWMGKPVPAGTPVAIQRGDAIRFANVELDWSKIPKVVTPQGLKKLYGIGSNSVNEIQLTEKTVSRFHATLMIFQDGKAYLEDHSKNGTVVNGEKIAYGKRVKVKRGDRVSFGGVVRNLDNYLPQPSFMGWLKDNAMKVGAAVLAAAVIVGGVYLFKNSDGERSDQWIFDRYQNATAIVIGGYHYEVTAGQLDLADLNSKLSRAHMPTIPTRVIRDADGNLVQSEDGSIEYNGTGFFVSSNGQVVTNLHVTNPWMADTYKGELTSEMIEQLVRSLLTQSANYLLQHGINVDIASYSSLVKCEGKLDYIGVLPNGQYFDADNVAKCRVVYAQGDNLDVDVALLSTVNGQLPKGASYVNVTDSLQDNAEGWKVGTHIYTIGFPAGFRTQNFEKSVAALGHGGDITQDPDDYRFGFDATSTHGSSGSPIFDRYGRLIGVLSSGINGNSGLNYGIKGKYIKELLDKSNNK